MRVSAWARHWRRLPLRRRAAVVFATAGACMGLVLLFAIMTFLDVLDARENLTEQLEEAVTEGDVPDAEQDRAEDEVNRATRRLAVVAGAGAAASALAAFGLWRALATSVLDPLEDLAAQARRVTAGEFDRPIEAGGPPEIASLVRDTEAMRRRIRYELALVEEAQAKVAAQAEELARSNADLEQFAYVASHDLQEPLRKVTSFCQLLERRYQGQLDERADQYIAFAVDGARRMQLLINDLLAFSRVGRTTETFEPVRCDDAFDRALQNLEAAIDETKFKAERGTLPVVLGDRSLLIALFQNILGNAIKFRSETPPRVEVTVEAAGEEWVFRLADNGIGIDDEYAERVFVIFQRLHSKERYPGTGIGLALCKKIVEFHGGRIWIEPGIDTGTAVCFTLPIAPEGASRD